MLRTATLSDGGLFRYTLGRDWSQSHPVAPMPRRVLLFCALNPSTGDHQVDDRSILKMVGFARSHDFTALEIVNLYAFRATDPRALRDSGWPIGPDNDWHISEAAARADGICLAWGTFASRTPRAGQVLRLLKSVTSTPLQCLHVTQDGHPSHPLYLPGDTRLRPFPLEL